MKHRVGLWVGCAVAVVLGTFVASAVAETPLTQAALTGPVTVNRATGGAVKGTITSFTPELLTVLPQPKPPHKTTGKTPPPPEPPPPEPIDVAWKDVRSVSNGLTARRALDVWKAQHTADLCPDCRGERTVWCPTCKGTHHDPAAAAECKTCHGELLVACKSGGEVDGKIPCPNGCLRRDAGNWTKGPDGLMRRTFNLGGGASMYAHEGHVGEIFLLDLKGHTFTNAGKCPLCGGTTRLDDPACHGTGKVPCAECQLRKSAPPCPAHCDAGRVACPTCKGTGMRAKV